MNKLADISISPSDGFSIPGWLNPTATNSQSLFNQVISISIGIMTTIAFIWFVFQFLIAAIAIIGSSGDKAKLAEAKGKVATSITGLIVVVSAVFIIELIGSLLGFSILGGALLFTN